MYFFAILFFVFKSKIANKYLILYLFLLAVIGNLQLLFVRPIGGRCLFLPYTLSALAIMLIFEYVVNYLNMKNIKAILTTSAVASIVLYSVLLFINISVWNVNNVRVSYVEEQMKTGTKNIVIINLPYEDFIHDPNEAYSYGYYFNYGDKDEMKFSYISYDEYLNSASSK